MTYVNDHESGFELMCAVINDHILLYDHKPMHKYEIQAYNEKI
jgi:hypothetical protein